MDFLLLITVVVITFISRIIPGYIGRNLNAPDHYYHLLAADEIRRNNFKLPERHSKFLIYNKFIAYPYFLHLVFSHFTKKCLETYSRFQSAIYDSLQVVIIFFFVKYFIANTITIAPHYLPYLCILSYAIYPIFFKIGDSRNITLNARPAGELFFNISFLALFLFLLSGNIFFLLGSVLFGALIFLSSKFGAQAYVFISIITGILSLNIFYVLLPFVSFLLAILISKGKYLKVLNGHITHSYFIYKIRGNPGIDCALIWKVLKQFKNAPIKAIEELYKFPLISILIHSPFYIFLFYFILSDRSFIHLHKEYKILIAWAIAGFITMIITSFRKTKFLGEADRYGLYCVFPLVVIVPVFINNNYDDVFNYIAISFYCLCLIYIIITFKVWSLMPSRKYHSELIKYLDSLPPSNCVTNPISLSYEMAYFTKHKILYNPPGFGYHLKNFNMDLETYKELYYKYPLITKNIKNLKDKYDLDYLIFKKKYAYKSYSNIKNLREGYELDSYRVLFENEDFMVLKIN
jgi:hypothetical protein